MSKKSNGVLTQEEINILKQAENIFLGLGNTMDIRDCVAAKCTLSDNKEFYLSRQEIDVAIKIIMNAQHLVSIESQ